MCSRIREKYILSKNNFVHWILPETNSIILIGQMIGLISCHSCLVIETFDDSWCANVVLQAPIGSWRQYCEKLANIQLLRCSTAKRSSTGLLQVGPTKVKARLSILFTKGPPWSQNKEHLFDWVIKLNVQEISGVETWEIFCIVASSAI